MRRLALILALLALAALYFVPAAPAAQFGLHDFDVTFTEADGSPDTQAGSHPFAMNTSFEVNSVAGKERPEPVEVLKDVFINQVVGFIGNQVAVSPCSTVDFLTIAPETGHPEVPECRDGAAVGKIAVLILPPEPGKPKQFFKAPVYLLEHAPGEAAKLGFWVQGIPVTADIKLSESPPYEIVGVSSNISQLIDVFGVELTLWGVPASRAHDEERGACHEGGKICIAGVPEVPFLTLPRACTGPLASSYEADSWPQPGRLLAGGVPDLSDPRWVSAAALTHDAAGNPQGFTGCGRLSFAPSITAQPTSKAAQSPTGLDFSLDVNNEGLTNPSGISDADVGKAEVTLPEGFSVNPSIAEGLAVCSEGQLARETSQSAPGEGCPNASKIGTVEVETPLLDEDVAGALYAATPYENPFGSLVALYMVIKNPVLGIVVTQPLRVDPDPATGRLTTVAENLPQLPFSHFRLHFREGTRSPLATPPACGSYDGHDAAHEPVRATLYPSSGEAPIQTTSAFQIISGPDSGPCPAADARPFRPDLLAGTINNAAGRYSPFYTRIARTDSEQEITNFSIKLPPGIVGKLAGIPYCPDAAIAAAKARTGPHGGQEEIESPSCSAASQVGRSLAGAGVGPSLAYAPGKIYLAGPYHGSALSLVSITAAKVGPFDLGTVVVRFALKINPDTAEVFVDATGSDPIPHIIQGIPVHLRDVRAYVDRPEFVINPTSCARTSTASTVLGSGANFASAVDDRPVTITSPFQAADCASLGFAPKLRLSLRGGTKRGAVPAFKALLTYPKGASANISSAQVTLPHSEFLEQGHIKTICTRAQYAQGIHPGEKCPAASVYGHAKAVTPILSDPIEGPVYLRSSSHNLPDLVAALHNGQIDINLVGRIDSVKGGRIRNTFESVPDAPVSSFVLEMRGGKRGLLVNSTNLCKAPNRNRAISHFIGQNGKLYDTRPVLEAQCKKARKGKHGKAKAHRPAHH